MDELRNIISIEKFKGKTYCVRIDDEEIYLNANIISEYHIKSDMQIPQSALEKIIFENEYRRAKERAFYLLDYRDHSCKEMRDKLLKNYCEEVCDAVVDKLLEIRLLDDRNYAEKYARQLFEIKRLGRYKARFEMQKKGIDKEIIEEILEQYDENTDERLSELIDKKYARYLTDNKGKDKVFNALVRKGYAYSEVREALNKYIDEEEY